MKRRQATATEILEAKATDIRLGWGIRYRRFVSEIYNPRASNGVSHRQYTRSKIRTVNNAPHVMYCGNLWELTGDMITLDTGREFVADLRIKSEHLP